MTTKTPRSRGKKIFLRILLTLVILLTVGGIFLYNNFNRLLSEALLKNFNSSLISDVYELKFEKLRVNLLEGSIRVNNVTFQPREKPLENYPYINSSFTLSTEKLNLIKVDIFTLLNEGKLQLEEISIIKPDIHLSLNGEKHVLFPYKDSTQVKNKTRKKVPIVAFKLNKFQLTEADFRGFNTHKESEFEFQDFSITLTDLFIDQKIAKDFMSFKHVGLTLGESHAKSEKAGLKQVNLHDFMISIDSLELEKSKDTLLYRFKDFKTGLSGLDIQTADSINHISLGSFQLWYKDSSIKLRNIAFKPNISDAEIQKKFKYQKVNASGSVAKININKINFDSLIYYRKIYIGEVLLDSVTANVFKDKLKPLDTNRFPEYFGQDIPKIPIPLLVKSVKATHVTLFNTERKPDSTYAKVSLNRASAQIQNITNLSTNKPLVLKADAYIDNKVHFNIALNFSYSKPQFSFNGSFKKFDLTKLNHLIKAYTPASVSRGQVDEISFSGVAEKKEASGTMKFLYHDLLVDLELKNQQKWKNSAIAFAANSILPSNNPASADTPPRIVKFHADRDMNKGFINIVLKSVLNGLKETMIMSKENKKTHNEEVKKKKQSLSKK